jgi:hypothetical protein
MSSGDENIRIDKIISDWQTATGDGCPFGLSFGQLVELAEIAVCNTPDGHPTTRTVKS